MKRLIEGEDRNQSTLFPECLEDYIAEDNPVRVIDVFVDELDLGQLGFGRIEPKVTGRPAYHPSMLLKLYIYAYLNRVQSSRRIEREAQRNVELMWLTLPCATTHLVRSHSISHGCEVSFLREQRIHLVSQLYFTQRQMCSSNTQFYPLVCKFLQVRLQFFRGSVIK